MQKYGFKRKLRVLWVNIFGKYYRDPKKITRVWMKWFFPRRFVQALQFLASITV